MEARVRVAADRHVEAAGTVHAPEAIEAGLVEIDEARRASCRGEVQGIEGADVLVVRFLVDVPGERVEHAVDVVSDLAVAVDQFGVVVAEDCAARGHGEEEGAAAHERLVVAAQGRAGRDVAQQLGEQRRLAADPFEEGRRSGALLGHLGAQGRLGAAKLQDGHARFGSMRKSR